METICKKAREINPDIFIICDAVQHAPHGVLAPERLGVDMMHFAPYKFFGVRGFALAWLSDRVAEFDHYRLLGKPKNDWEIGSPATAQFAAVQQVIEYVVALGQVKNPDETNRRGLYAAGMKRIADHERGLLELMLEGTEKVPGLRHVFDTGNMIAQGDDPVEFYNQLAPYLSHAHLKDMRFSDGTPTPGYGVGDFCANGRYMVGVLHGEGMVDFAALLPRIKKSGFDGYMAVEYVPQKVDSDFAAEMIQCREYLERLWNQS